MELGIGTRVSHPKFGEGVIIDDAHDEVYEIYFSGSGEKEISKSFEGLVIAKVVQKDPNSISIDVVRDLLTEIIEPLISPEVNTDLGEKWEGGNLIMVPGKEGLQSKEVPIETFFHKIVMVRDRVRVMEQKINSSNLSESEKIDLQQYITRIYGSLTTFNILFDKKEHHFKGAGGK